MASSSILSTLPSSGTYPLNLSTSVQDILRGGSALNSKKRQRESDEVVAFRYTFKPGSITSDIPGTLVATEGKGQQLAFDTPGGGQQVFDAREEISKSRECVLIWDEASQSYTLHALSTTLHLTLNRNLTSSTHRTIRATSPASASTASSLSIPLSSNVQNDQMPQSKRSRQSSEDNIVVAVDPQPTRPMRSGKSLPKKAPLPPHPAAAAFQNSTRSSKSGKPKTPTKAGKKLPSKAATTAATKKGGKGKAPPPVPSGKFKSAEIIEDSDEETGGGEEDEEDEFARLVGESLADPSIGGGLAQDEYEDDEDEDDDEEDEDEARELGGARLVVRNETVVSSGISGGKIEGLSGMDSSSEEEDSD